MSMWKEFKEFAVKGNAFDLAVGVIIGAAFGRIVSALTESVIMPLIGWITGGINFSNFFIRLGKIPASYKGEPDNYQQLKQAGVAMIGYGEFITQLVNFMIVAWIIFLLVKAANRLILRRDELPAPKPPAEVQLLTEIRDELRKRT
jgi:large conductance mechanosensitive channel